MPDMICCHCGFIHQYKHCESCGDFNEKIPDWITVPQEKKVTEEIILHLKQLALQRAFSMEDFRRRFQYSMTPTDAFSEHVYLTIIQFLMEQTLPDIEVVVPEFYCHHGNRTRHKAVLKTAGLRVIYPLLPIDRRQVHRILPPETERQRTHKNLIIKKILAQTREG